MGTGDVEASASSQTDEEEDFDLDDITSLSPKASQTHEEHLDAKANEPVFKKNLRDPMDLGAIPSTVPRGCTDLPWLFLFLALTGLAGYVAYYVIPLGQPTALLRLPDWRGEHCGMGSNENRTLLFFCPHSSDPKRLEMWYPICVEECPEGGTVICPKNLNHETTTTLSTTQPYFYHSIRDAHNGGLPYPPYQTYGNFPQGQAFAYPFYREQSNYPPVIYPEHAQQQLGGYYAMPPNAVAMDPWRSRPSRRLGAMDVEDVLDYVETLVDPDQVVYSDWRGNFTLYQVKTYPSASFVGMVCKPWQADLERQVQTWIDETPLVNTWSTLINSYWPLLVTSGTGVVMSYVYITLLRFRAAMLVQTGMLILVVGPLATGAYFFWCWKHDGQCWGGTGNKLEDGIVCIGATLIGVTFMTISWHLQQDIQLAIECIEWSCKAILETPSLKLEPVLALTCRAVVDLAAAAVVTLILTSDLRNEDFCHAAYKWILPPQSELQMAMLGICALWCLWTNWIITAVSDFVIMYTTELWVFTGGLTKRGGHAPCCSVLQAYFVCLRYHLGTMVLGGFVVGAMQPIRITFGIVAAIIQLEENSVALLSCFCDWLVEIYLKYLEPWSRNAYMDVALNSRAYVDSACHVSRVNQEFMSTVNILNGATWLFQLAGLGAITSLGYLQTCLVIKYYPGFEDPYSPDFIQNPLMLSLCGAAVAFITSFPFMMIFDTVSDTILYAYIVQKMREEKEEEHTMYTKAWGCLEAVDAFFGIGWLEPAKDYSIPQFLDESDAESHASRSPTKILPDMES